MMLLGTQRVNERGRLEIGGVDAVELAREFGTPLYVMDEAAIRENCRRYVAAFAARYPRVAVSFAGKAFLCRTMCRIVEQEGLNLDVASGGELYLALQAKFPASRISLHGNSKSYEELRMGLEAGVGHIVIDNRLEIERLAELTAGRPARQPVLVRVAPGIDPHTHRRISTGQVDTKFGFDIQSGAALQAVTDVCNLPGLEFRGLHCHVGSQLHDTDCHRSSVGIMVDLMAEIRGELGVTVEELNIGGGLGIRYLSSHRPPTLDEFADAVTGAVREKLDEHALPAPILLQEPGRFLVGEAGTTLYTLGAIKEVPGIRTYVSVDGGLSDNPRPALYDAKYEAILANRASEPHDRPYTVAGKHCETDVLFWDLPLPEVRSGDVLAVQSTGAYNFVMASNYNRFLRPGVVLVADGRADLAVRRETYEDLLRTDVMPERLA